MTSYASLKFDSGASQPGDDLIVLSTAGPFQCCLVEAMIWFSPEGYFPGGADIVPPVPIAGVNGCPAGTGPIAVGGHLSSPAYVVVDGPSVLATDSIGTTTATNVIQAWYGIRLRWRGVFQVVVNTDWYLSYGYASPNLLGHWRGHVRLGFW